MNIKKIISILLLTVLLMGNLSIFKDYVYGAAESVTQEEDELYTRIHQKNSEDDLKTGDKASLDVKMKNNSKEKALFKLYFCQAEERDSVKEIIVEESLKFPAQNIKLEGMNEENKLPVTLKNEKEEIEEIYLDIKNEEQEGLYSSIEIPADGEVAFELNISSEVEGTVLIIPVMESSTIIYGNMEYLKWHEKKELPKESCKFRTRIPQKGGTVGILYAFEEAQWTTIFPKKEGYATADTLPGGTIIKTVITADSGYHIAACRILGSDGKEVNSIDESFGKEVYEYEIEILNDDITMEVIFEEKRELTFEELEYQKQLEFVYHRDACAKVKEDMGQYKENSFELLGENENRMVPIPEKVHLKVGNRISYPSQMYSSHEFNISGCDGIVDVGYCMHPNKRNPSSGWYSKIGLLDVERPEYANAYKLIMLTNYGLDLQAFGDFWFGVSDQGQKKYREIYIHAIIGYLETGTLLGLNSQEKIGVINIANDVFKRANNGEVEGLLKRYRVYEIHTGNNSLQNICFMTRSSKGGISIQKKSENLEITQNNENYTLQDAVYGIYSDEGCTNQIMTMTTDENGYAATTDDALEDGKYYVKEQKPSKGYMLDKNIYIYDIAGGGKAEENKKVSIEPPKKGEIQIVKASGLPDISDKNTCYSLEGAEYGIYKSKDCKEKVDSIVVDYKGNGVSSYLPLGNYYIKETKAPKGYKLDETVYTVSLMEKEEAITTELLKTQDYPEYDTVGIRIIKKGKIKENLDVPTLEGTQFTIKYYNGYFDKNNLPDAEERLWVLEVKKNKEGENYLTELKEEYLIKNLSDKFYKDENGMPVLPYGTITIQETKAAPGYTLNGELKDKNGKVVAKNSELYVAQIRKQEGTILLEGGNEFTAEDELSCGSIKIKKYQTDEHTSLPGAEFEIKDSLGEVLAIKSTDENGEIIFDQLYPGTYTITEIKTTEGNTLMKEPLIVKIPIKVTKKEIEEKNIDENKCIYDSVEDVYYIYNFVYEITNHANFQIPMTGGESQKMLFLYLAAGITIFIGTVMMTIKKKNRI